MKVSKHKQSHSAVHGIFILMLIAIVMSSSAHGITNFRWSGSTLFSHSRIDSVQINIIKESTCDASRYTYLGYDYPGFNVKAGTCRRCTGTGILGIGSIGFVPSGQDSFSECNGLSCSNYYEKRGNQSPLSTEYCYNKANIPSSSHFCNGAGACQTAASMCPTSSDNQWQYSCGTCKYIASGCTGTTLGSCTNYAAGTSCGTNYYSGNNYCSGGNVYRNRIEPACSSGNCIDTINPVLQQTCSCGCSDGVCLPCPVVTGMTASPNPWTIPEGSTSVPVLVCMSSTNANSCTWCLSSIPCNGCATFQNTGSHTSGYCAAVASNAYGSDAKSGLTTCECSGADKICTFQGWSGSCYSGSCIGGPELNCCTPHTCSSLGYNCGSHSDGCGGTINCGTCNENYSCNSGICIGDCKTCTKTHCYRDIYWYSDSNCLNHYDTIYDWGPANPTNSDGSWFCAPNDYSPYWNGGPCSWRDTTYYNDCDQCGSY